MTPLERLIKAKDRLMDAGDVTLVAAVGSQNQTAQEAAHAMANAILGMSTAVAAFAKRETVGTQDQPPPLLSGSPPIWDLVVDDMRARDTVGEQLYGTRLRANNGRKPLRDLYHELLDACAYVRQAIYEQEGK